MALPADEMARIDGNPVFELYDFGYTDDLRRLIQIENFVTVNNALQVDLTGQVSAESIGQQMYTGVGGQTVFMIAGAYSPGGKSVSVTPSSSVPTATGQRISADRADARPGRRGHRAADLRRLRRHRAGHRHAARQDDQGAVRALLEVTHPDFRDQLEAEAAGSTASDLPRRLGRRTDDDRLKAAADGFYLGPMRCRCSPTPVGSAGPGAGDLAGGRVDPVPGVDRGDVDHQRREGGLVVVARRPRPTRRRARVGPVGQAGDALGQRQRGPLGVGVVRRLAPRGDGEDPLVGSRRRAAGPWRACRRTPRSR